MKNLNQTMRFIMLLTVLIGFGLSAVSQNTISNFQLKQIRLLENQAKTDSLKVLKLKTAIDTLNSIVELTNSKLNNCEKVQKLQSEKIEFQEILINNRNEKVELSKLEKKGLKKQIRNRTLIIIGSAILNTTFIYKAIK